MLRTLFIEKYKNTKTKNFKALNIGKKQFKNREIKNLVHGNSTNEGEIPTL